MGTLTVRENLCFSAALRLSSAIKMKEKEDRVNRLISDLGLSKVADRRVLAHMQTDTCTLHLATLNRTVQIV